MALLRDLFWLQKLIYCGVPLKMRLLGALHTLLESQL